MLEIFTKRHVVNLGHTPMRLVDTTGKCAHTIHKAAATKYRTTQVKKDMMGWRAVPKWTHAVQTAMHDATHAATHTAPHTAPQAST